MILSLGFAEFHLLLDEGCQCHWWNLQEEERGYSLLGNRVFAFAHAALALRKTTPWQVCPRGNAFDLSDFELWGRVFSRKDLDNILSSNRIVLIYICRR